MKSVCVAWEVKDGKTATIRTGKHRIEKGGKHKSADGVEDRREWCESSMDTDGMHQGELIWAE